MTKTKRQINVSLWVPPA